MALIDKIKAIADAIRNKTGDTAPMTLDEMAESIEYLEGDGGPLQTFILVDEDGHEMQAFLTEEEVELNATSNDIRIGMTAVTDAGVTVGEKEIPGYHAAEGSRKIAAGADFVLPMYGSLYDYTKMQAIFCLFNTKIGDSVAADKVSIAGKVYETNSASPIATVSLDEATETIIFNIKNNTEKPYVLRYFILKEEE
jgi:hypothetical protein